MAKSSPPSVLVRLQESLHRVNSTPARFLVKNIQKPQQAPGPPLQEGFYVFVFPVFTVHPYDRIFLNLRTQPLYTVLLNLQHRTQPLQYSVLHRTQPLQYTFTQISPQLHLCKLHGVPASLSSLQAFTLSKCCLMCCPSASLHNDPQPPASPSPPYPQPIHRWWVQPCVPESQNQAARVPLAFTKTAYLSQSTPPEYVIDMSWTQSHWGPLEEVLLGPQAAHASLSASQWASLPSGDLQSHNVHHHYHLLPLFRECWVLVLLSICIALVLPSISAYCARVHHQGDRYPYSPSWQLGKFTLQCQQQSTWPCSANRNSLPIMSFQCYPVNHPQTTSLPPEAISRG